MFKPKTKYPLTLDIQYFAEGGDGGGASSQGSDGGDSGDGAKGGQGDNNPTFTPEQQAQIDKMIERAQDQLRDKYGKETKDLRATLEQLQNAGKSKEQLAEEAQRKLEEGQRELLAEKNKFYSIKQLAKSGLDAELLTFVQTTEGEDEDARNAATDAKIQALTDLIDKQVQNRVAEKFKEVGYNPGNGNQSSSSSGFKSMSETIRQHQIKK